jgi:hypothetical protein
MALARVALFAIACVVTTTFPVGNTGAGEPPAAAAATRSSPALIGLPPSAQPKPAPQSNRKLWIALGVLSGAAVVGAGIALGITFGTASHDNSVFHDWGTLTVTKR